MTSRQLTARVVKFLAKEYDVSYKEIWTETRRREIVRVRQMAWLYLDSFGYTLKEIGTLFGRDHTTVLHGIRQSAFDVMTYPDDARTYRRLRRRVERLLRVKHAVTKPRSIRAGATG